MKRKEYEDLALESFPNEYFPKMFNGKPHLIDLVKKVGELLFIRRDEHSPLVEETRKQLVNLREYGHCRFDVERITTLDERYLYTNENLSD